MQELYHSYEYLTVNNLWCNWLNVHGLQSSWRQPQTHTHSFNGPLSGTTQVSQYQKGKTNLDFTEARDSGWHWHQLGHNASLHLAPDRQPLQHSTTLMFFTGRMPFLLSNQQRQSTEGNHRHRTDKSKVSRYLISRYLTCQ